MKIRIILLIAISLYFIIFAALNQFGVTVILPFFKTFAYVPLYIVITFSVLFGVTLQFLTSTLTRRRKRK